MSYLNIPNLLTLFRISLIPIFMIIFYLPFKGHHVVSSIIFAVAAITDWFDGYLARKLKQVSALGEFLDPVADKLIVVVALVLLVESYPSAWLTIPVIVIVCREIVILALREWMSVLGKRQKVAVIGLGKFKTAAQMLAIILLISQNPAALGWVTYFGYGLMYIAAFLTLWSMGIYLRAAWHEIIQDHSL